MNEFSIQFNKSLEEVESLFNKYEKGKDLDEVGVYIDVINKVKGELKNKNNLSKKGNATSSVEATP